jgi:rSAM/selenodomain-associated transferase 2
MLRHGLHAHRPDLRRARGCSAMTRISIVVPVLDEAAGIVAALQALAPLRAQGHEVIVVDGPRGRARQMNAGAALAGGEVLLFLHADTLLPPEAAQRLCAAVQGGALWGRFDVRIAGDSAWFPVIAALMNWRSRLSGIATGDQGIFVQTALFRRLGGYAEQPLMEDVELSRRLRDLARPACLKERVLTSGRRWETRGVWRTIWLMWRLRWAYWRGAAPEALARAYK